MFTMVEGPLPNTTQEDRVSFNMHNDRRVYDQNFYGGMLEVGWWVIKGSFQKHLKTGGG